MPEFGTAKGGDRTEGITQVQTGTGGLQEGFQRTVAGVGEDVRELLESKKKLDKIDNDAWLLDTVNSYMRDSRTYFGQQLSKTGKDTKGSLEDSDARFAEFQAEIRANAPSEEYANLATKRISDIFNPLQNNLAAHGLKQLEASTLTSINDNINEHAEQIAISEGTRADIEKALTGIRDAIQMYGEGYGQEKADAVFEQGKAIVIDSWVKSAIKKDPQGTEKKLEAGFYDEHIDPDQRAELIKFARTEEKVDTQQKNQFVKDKNIELDKKGMDMLLKGNLEELNNWVTNDPEVIQFMPRSTRNFYFASIKAMTGKGATKDNKEAFNRYKAEIYKNPYLYEENDIFLLEDVSNDEKTKLVDITRKQRDPKTWDYDKRLLWKDMERAIGIKYKKGDYGTVESQEALDELERQKDAAFEFLASTPREDTAKAADTYKRTMASVTEDAGFLWFDKVVPTINRGKIEDRTMAIRALLREGVPLSRLKPQHREQAIQDQLADMKKNLGIQ